MIPNDKQIETSNSEANSLTGRAPETAVTPQSNGTAGPIKQDNEIRDLLGQLSALEESMCGPSGSLKWAARFTKRFHVKVDESLPEEKYQAALFWLRNRLKDLKRSWQFREDSLLRRAKYSTIKTKMRWMGKDADKKKFYLELRQVLGLKKEFSSLTEVSNKELDRILTYVEQLQPPLAESVSEPKIGDEVVRMEH